MLRYAVCYKHQMIFGLMCFRKYIKTSPKDKNSEAESLNNYQANIYVYLSKCGIYNF